MISDLRLDVDYAMELEAIKIFGLNWIKRIYNEFEFKYLLNGGNQLN